MIRLLKLKNNLDIIAEIRGKNKDSFILHRPFRIHNMPVPSEMGMRVVQLMKPWIENSDDISIDLPSDSVLVTSLPTPDLVRKYNYALEKEDVAHDIAAEIQNDPEQLQGFIERMIREELDEMDGLEEQMDEGDRLEEIEERMESAENIDVNFRMSPGMFFHFLANGIMGIDEDNGVEFDTDAFMEKFEEFKKKKEKPSPPKKRPPPRQSRRDDWDFGSQFDNWDPEP